MLAPRDPIPLGDFELRHPIGRGAMGEVWAGVHRAQDTPVAIKILTGAVAERAGYALSFRQEVRAVAGMDHPNIVTVYDFGHIPEETATQSKGRYPAGRPFLVMELVEGGSLAARRGNLEWRELNDILLALLDALGHAHARGLIHRDLKPHNVMLPMGPHEPAVKLTDFGLAHALDRHADDPWREHLAGTPNYMAPEQIECRWRDYGPWTDLYAFGCLAWSLVTGVPPFAARDPREVLRSQVRRPPPRMAPELLRKKKIPQAFHTWLLRLMEKEPGRRYLRAADAAWALLNLADGKIPLTAEEAAPTQWQLPIVGTIDAPDPEEAAYTAGRALTWTVEDLSSVSDDESSQSIEAPPMPAAWTRPGDEEWQPLAGAGLGLFGLRAVPLVARNQERDRLWTTLRRVHRDGLPRATVLRGAPGLGKRHLARWLCERAHEVGAATVLRVTHSPVTTAHDGLAAALARFHGCEDLNRSAIVDRMSRVLDELAPGDAGRTTETAHLLAEFITSARGDFGPPMPRERRFEVLAAHLRRLGRRRPLVLVLEDAQWGDDAVAFGQGLLDGLDDVRAMLILTVRSGAADSEAVTALERHPATERITVGPLSDEHMPALVHALLGLESDAAAQIRERCEGNPLFAVQMVGDWVERGILVPGAVGFDLREGAKIGLPDGVHDLWNRRLGEALPEAEQRHALEIAALLGQSFDQGLWLTGLRSAGLPGDPLMLDRLADRGLMIRDDAPADPVWTFAHGMLRESLIRNAEEGERLKPAHLWCAEALATKKKRIFAERRARHFIAADVLKPALKLLIEAGHWRLDEGFPEKSKAILQEWTRLAHTLKLPPGDWRRGEARLLSCRIARVEDDHDRAGMLARAALREGEEYGWPKVVEKALVDMGWAANRQGNWEVALARFNSATEAARARNSEYGLISTLRNQASILLDRGDFDTVMGLLDEALSYIGDRPLHHALGLTQLNRAVLLRRHGHFEDAEKALDAAEVAFEAGTIRWGLARVQAGRGVVALARGDVPAALRFLGDAASRQDVIRGTAAAWARLDLARARLANGQVAEAKENFADELLESRNRKHDASEFVADLGLLHVAALEKDWRAWRKCIDSIRDRIRVRQSTTRDAIAMTEQAAEAAKAQGEPARAKAALLLALEQWKLLGIKDEIERLTRAVAAVEKSKSKPQGQS